MSGKPKAGPPRMAMPPLPALLQQAIGHHRAGRLGEAEALYGRVLSAQPRQADALNLLGLLRYQRGDAAAALGFIDKALAVTARVPDYHNNRGMALGRLGRFDEAVVSYRRALALRPAYPEAQYNLGNALRAVGDTASACAAYRAALAARPEMADAQMNLGNLLMEMGDAEAAIEHLERAVALRRTATGLSNLGAALRVLGRVEAAAERLREALALDPQMAEAHYNLARLCHAQGDYADAAEHGRRVLEQRPDDWDARKRLVRALLRLDRAGEALDALSQAPAPDESDPQLHLLTGRALEDTNQFGPAVAAYRRAAALDPDREEPRLRLATALLAMGDVAAAAAGFAALAESPLADLAAVSNHAMSLNYADDVTAEAVAAAHRAAGARLELLALPLEPVPRDRDPERRLRIGYVSSDFRRHSCAFFIEPLLSAHDRAGQVEVFCYANVRRSDHMTERLRGYADGWRDILDMSDAAAAAQVQADGIDILVDLNGHTGGHRLGLFALRPAPIQVSWLGYPNSTGLTRMDYRLTDEVADPPGLTDALHTEMLLRLGRVFTCYRPPDKAPEVGPPPAEQAGHVTFGCFNNLQKLGPRTVATWSAILHAVPDARLVLKARAFADEETRVRYRSLFAAHDVGPERVGLYPFTVKQQDGLKTYGVVDIALDPFPYNGTTTTCEALWMGVPVIALEGDRHAARVGSSLLHAVGLDECVAASLEDYRAKAVALAKDPARMAAFRRTLRARMAASPLCDSRGFAAAVEAAYRAIWERWCAAQE